ncbi:BTAD domain-containing putative transcriptional regulator [Nocardia sp. NPDC127526]|uniref:BTAD domain-containing putative transcriptional regulator n=1 Tax=Nocardia sp. NPDC127526 TaxID=3345393 RepID=UPI00363CDC45
MGVAAPMVDLRVLGPVGLSVDGVSIIVPGTKLRALLAVLTLNRRRTVTRAALLRVIWEEDAPSRSENVVYSCVSMLRSVLHEAGVDDRAVLRTMPGGYLLDIADEHCDAGRFESACTRGRIAANTGDPELAAKCFAEALAQWSGEAVADLRELSFAANFAADMAERRLNALADRIEAEIDCGAAGTVIGELTALTTEHSRNERFWRLLIRALYEAGRQADALDACRGVRNALREAGIDPDPATVALESAVRNQDPLPPGPARLPAHKNPPRTTVRDGLDVRRSAWLRIGDATPVAIPAEGLSIGRDADNDVVLDDSRVSRQHARVLHRGGEIFLRDRDSANGVYLNGEPIVADTALSDGDEIVIGATKVVYELHTGEIREKTRRTGA